MSRMVAQGVKLRLVLVLTVVMITVHAASVRKDFVTLGATVPLYL